MSTNGLLACKTVYASAATDSNYFVKVGAEGNSEIVGDLTVGGDIIVGNDIYASTVISIPEATGNPFYIKNPNNIGTAPLSDNAVVIEGGNNRSLDEPAAGVGLALTKPFTSGLGEDIGTLSMYGKDAVGAEARYAYIRAGSRGNTAGNVKGSLQFGVAGALLEMDGSANIFNTVGDLATQLRGSVLIGDALKADRTLRFVDTLGTYNIPFSLVNRITGTPVSSVLPLNGTTYTFVPRYSGTYCVEMTCGFGGSGAAFSISGDAIGFVISPGGDDDYGAAIAAARVIPGFGTTGYTCSSLQSFIAGTTYSISVRYVGAPVLGANGAFLIEVSFV